MSLPALTGCISQSAAAAASAPSAVSIATAASSGYNNAVIVTGNSTGIIEDGSNFDDTNPIDVTITLVPHDPNSSFTFHGYLRASGATLYQWDSSDTDELTYGGMWAEAEPGPPPPSIAGVASTTQDAISAGISRTLTINGPPQPGDFVIVEITADATNATGTTEATPLLIKILYDF